MKFIILLLISLYIQTVFGQIECIDKLLPYSRTSANHHIDQNEWMPSGSDFDSVNARIALNSLVGGKLLCKQDEFHITLDPVCKSLITDVPESIVCYAESNLGTFLMNIDSFQNVNFTFRKK